MATPASASSPHAEIVIDLGAVRHNVSRLRELVSTEGHAPQLMVVVKADAYGHGMLPVARAARRAGAEWLGVATGDEALALRHGGDSGRLLCWLAAPGAEFAPLVQADVDVTASSVAQLDDIVRGAREVGRPARLQLKFDTGLSRGGAPRTEWLSLVTGCPRGRGRGTGARHRSVVPLRLRRRTRPPRQRARSSRRSTRPVPSPRTPACAPRCGTSPTLPGLCSTPGRVTTSSVSASPATA